MTRPVAQRLAAWLALAAALGVAAWWAWRAEPALPASKGDAALAVPVDAAGASDPAAPAATAQADANAASATAAAAAPAADTALPPPAAPVAEIFDALLQRARAGDARAACRLAVDLQRCRMARVQPRMAEHIERRAISEADPQRRESMIEYLAQIESDGERAAADCAGLEPQQLDMAFALQLQAAHARPELRVWAALNPALDAQFFVNDLERWQQYRSVAMPWLQAAAAEGDIAAMIALARVHGDPQRRGPPAPPLREPDDARLVAYATLLERYGIAIPPLQRGAEAARARLAPSDLAAATRQAETWFKPEVARTLAHDAMSSAMRRSFNPVPQRDDCD